MYPFSTRGAKMDVTATPWKIPSFLFLFLNSMYVTKFSDKVIVCHHISLLRFCDVHLKGQRRPDLIALRCYVRERGHRWISGQAKCRHRYKGQWGKHSVRSLWLKLALVEKCKGIDQTEGLLPAEANFEKSLGWMYMVMYVQVQPF